MMNSLFGFKMDPDTNIVDGVEKVDAWRDNIKPQYMQQCFEEALDIIRTLPELESFQHIEADMQQRISKVLIILKQVEDLVDKF